MAFNNEKLIEFNAVRSSSSLETLGSKNGENGDFFQFCIFSSPFLTLSFAPCFPCVTKLISPIQQEWSKVNFLYYQI